MKFAGSGITEELYNWIRAGFPVGKTIVEFGAGEVSTQILCQFYDLYSIEHDLQWIGKYNSTYIHAKLVNGWYDPESIRESLPESYDLILIDGPPGEGNRNGILDNLDLIRTDVPIIVDDTAREGERQLAAKLAEKLGKQIQVYENFSVLV